MATHDYPATFLPPGGEPKQGAEEVVRVRQRREAVRPGSESRLQVLHRKPAASPSGAESIVMVKTLGSDMAEPVKVRIMEVFRPEEGDGKLVHRYADILPQAGTGPEPCHA